MAAQTGIEVPCTGVPPPGESNARCAAIGKALWYPKDLINNKQNTLAEFSKTFVEVSVFTFALLSIIALYWKKKSSVKSSGSRF